MMTMSKSYSELIKLDTFEDRFDYLSLDGIIGKETFGFDRWVNQRFYTSKEWKKVRDFVITRDGGCDLAIPDRKLYYGSARAKIIVHHINPISLDDIENSTSYLLDPENLITTSELTHDAIHFGNKDILVSSILVVRQKNDTCPWR